MAKGLSKSVHHNEVLLYRGCFWYILPPLGQKISSVIPRTSFRLVISKFHRNTICNDFLLTCMPLKKEKQIHTNLLFQILLNNSRDSFNRFCKTNIIIMFIKDIFLKASKLIIDNTYLTLPTMEM